jgi:hypothetical protein
MAPASSIANWWVAAIKGQRVRFVPRFGSGARNDPLDSAPIGELQAFNGGCCVPINS